MTDHSKFRYGDKNGSVRLRGRWPKRALRRAAKAGILTSDDGMTCPRCGGQTERRTHAVITEKLLAKPFYYRQWFYCHDINCKTRLIMCDEDRVFAEAGLRLTAIKEQLCPRL